MVACCELLIPMWVLLLALRLTSELRRRRGVLPLPCPALLLSESLAHAAGSYLSFVSRRLYRSTAMSQRIKMLFLDSHLPIQNIAFGFARGREQGARHTKK